MVQKMRHDNLEKKLLKLREEFCDETFIQSQLKKKTNNPRQNPGLLNPLFFKESSSDILQFFFFPVCLMQNVCLTTK